MKHNGCHIAYAVGGGGGGGVVKVRVWQLEVNLLYGILDPTLCEKVCEQDMQVGFVRFPHH